jgi:electron transport complex protein RnfG
MQVIRNMLISAFLLGLFAVLGVSLVATVFENTAETIAENERFYLLRSLNTLVPSNSYDNDLYHDTIEVIDPQWLGTPRPVTIYRARKAGEPVAVIINAVAPDGYSGNINLLVAIRHDGILAGVRVISHRETPGLGDAIDAQRSDWILGFSGKSLNNPEDKGWAVRRDGGEFDQFTGATITPRAVVKAVQNALKYYAEHQALIFASPASTTQDDS